MRHRRVLGRESASIFGRKHGGAELEDRNHQDRAEQGSGAGLPDRPANGAHLLWRDGIPGAKGRVAHTGDRQAHGCHPGFVCGSRGHAAQRPGREDGGFGRRALDHSDCRGDHDHQPAPRRRHRRLHEGAQGVGSLQGRGESRCAVRGPRKDGRVPREKDPRTGLWPSRAHR